MNQEKLVPSTSTTDDSARDARQQEPGAERSELWHFDAALDNGMTFAVGFCVVGVDPARPDHTTTVVNVMLTTKDGRQQQHAIQGTVRTAAIGTTRCHLPFGGNRVDGDLQHYDVLVATDDQTLRLDLHYEAKTVAYEPAIAAPALDRAAVRIADLILPRCSVAGTVTIDGTTETVTGEGAHDHQWFTANPMTTWHHWLWGHIYTESYSAVIFDLVTGAELGTQRIPVFGVFDATGALVFDNSAEPQIVADLAVDPDTGKEQPESCTYTFTDGVQIWELGFRRTETLTAKNLYAEAQASADSAGGEMGAMSQQQYDAMRIRPSYGRYRADATLVVPEAEGPRTEAGTMIYEFNYPAGPDSSTLVTGPPTGS